MLEQIQKRFEELLAEGQEWIRRPKARDNWAQDEAYGWLTAAANLVELVTRGRGSYMDQARAILGHKYLETGVPMLCIKQMVGLLQAVQSDWNKGLLRQIEYLISAENFDAFLDHAEKYHKGGKAREAGVLVSVVFEDTIRKLGKKHSLDQSSSIESLIDGLVDCDAVTPVAGRRLKSVASLRNKALHAKWDEFDIRDVGEAVRTTRELVETAL
ncbi:MAG: hypothetical protein ACE5KK_05925 [Candidatus Brocadiales bacterium]